MSNTRQEKYKEFENFSQSINKLFDNIASSDPDNENFNRYYTLCICPGGRNGGMDHRIAEIFYGHRPYDREETIEGKKLLTEWGATLLYQRTDAGSVICTLGPAGTSYYSQPEDAIVLEYVDDPSDLRSKVNSHWHHFISYMKCTSLDGNPSFTDKLRVYKLRLLHDTIVDHKLQGKKIISFLEVIGRYVATVWLSGFLLFLLTKCSEDKQLTTLRGTNAIMTRQLEYLRHIDQQQADTIKLLTKKIDNVEGSLSEVLRRSGKK